MSCDELNTIDNQSWWYVHVYVTKEQKRLSILLNLQRMIDGSIVNNLTFLIIQSLVEYGRLNEVNVARKLICFGVDEVTIFNGVKSGVTIQLMQKHVPFVSDVHYMAHCTNLVVHNLSGLKLLFKIESMFVSIYNYFFHSLKKHLEAIKLVEFLENKSSKILKNIKTCWISMLSPSK